MTKWDVNLIPDLTGKVAIVTGGNTGLGYQSSLELARNGATVVIACRTLQKGDSAVAEIKRLIGQNAKLDVIQLDLADYESVRLFAKSFIAKYRHLDILMNNAGVVNQKEKGITKSGCETHIGTNHFGHFLLTGLMVDLLLKTPKARVVTLSSGGYKQGNIQMDDINWEKRVYHRVKSYGDSKLANLLFAFKLQQFFNSKGSDAISVAAHPGLSASPRQQAIGIGGKISKWIASPLSRGCRPQLLAATGSKVKGLDYYGPKYGIDGPPVLNTIKHKQYTQEVADELWTMSEEHTQMKFK